MHRIEVGCAAIKHVRMNQESPPTVGIVAKAINLALGVRVGLDHSPAQRFPFDEVLRQLIERTVEVIVDPRVGLKRADQNFAIHPMIAIERKAGAPAEVDSVGGRLPDQIVGHLACFVENEMKDSQFRVVDEEEADRRLVEAWTEERFVGRKRAMGRLNVP